MKKDTEKVIIKETIRREFGRYDNEESNELILTFLVIDKIISSLIEQNIQPSVAIHYFDQWSNLYISSNYELEFSDDSREVTCNFIVNSKSEPDKYLMLSIGYLSNISVGRSIMDPLINKIADMNQVEPDELNEIEENYLNIVDELGSSLDIFLIIGMYLNEQFTECRIAIDNEYLESEENQLLFLIVVISINIDLINGNGGDALEDLELFKESNLDIDQFLDFKSGVYWTVGLYLEERSKGIKSVLTDKSFPEAEKFWFLYSMSLTRYLEENLNKRHHYLKLAEKYIGSGIYNVLLLAERYNDLGFWKDALHLIHVTEREQVKNQLLDIPKAKALIVAEKYPEAIELLKKAMADIDEENVDLMTYMADCLIASGNSQEGIALLERVLEIEPDYNDALLILGLHNFVEVKNYRKALRYLLAAEKQGELLPEVYDILADIYEDLGLMKKSQEYRNKAISNLPVSDQK